MAEELFELSRLQKIVAEYEAATCWDTTCLNCSRTLDRLYLVESQLAQLRMKLRAIIEKPEPIYGYRRVEDLEALL